MRVVAALAGLGVCRVRWRIWSAALLLLVIASCSAYDCPLNISLTHQTPPPEKNCLGGKAVYPRKYVSYNGSILRLLLGTSSRVTQQLVTQVGYIFLKEVLGYPDVGIMFDSMVGRQYFNNTYNVLTRLSHSHGRQVTGENNQPLHLPHYMINMEVWFTPDRDDDLDLFSASDWGSITSPGRFGWFIPRDLSKAGPNQSLSLDHWKIFKEPITARLLHQDELYISRFTSYMDTNNGGGTQFYCQLDGCSVGYYIPEKCRNNRTNCATLLADYPTTSDFVIEDIETMDIYVEVAWVGPHLAQVIEEITTSIRKAKNGNSVIFLGYTPSELLPPAFNETPDFALMCLPPCEFFPHYKSRLPCRYNAHRIVKLAWSKLEKSAKFAYEALHDVFLEPEDYREMLLNYNRQMKDLRSSGDSEVTDANAQDVIWSVACSWMKGHQAKKRSRTSWLDWVPQNKEVHTFNIGGIFPLANNLHISKGTYIGAEMAEDAITHNKAILEHYRLGLFIKDGHCQADVVMRLFFDYIMHSMEQLVGILGPACSNTVEPLAGIAKHYRVVVISYSAEGSNFSDRKKYPYFFRTIGENKQYMYVYLELLKKLEWKRIASITEDGTKYTEYISHTQDLLQANNITFVANRKFPQDWQQEAMHQYLEELKSKNARVIVADINDEAARAVMCEAYQLGMTGREGYVWFLPIWLQDGWYNVTNYNTTRGQLSCNTTQMLQAIEGYFALSHSFYAPNDTLMQENITVGEWRTKYAARCIQANTPQSNYAGYAYDAYWTYALALDKLTKENDYYAYTLHSENSTKRFVELIQATNFHGVSGHIKFGDGSSRYSIVNVLQWVNREHTVVGIFYPNLTDGKKNVYEGGRLELESEKIRWLYGGHTPPWDGTPDSPTCVLDFLANFLDSGCEVAWIVANIIGFGVLGVMIITAFFVVKHRYDKRVKLTQKYMRSLGIDLLNQPKMETLDKWEIPRDRVVINRKLGEGAFGTVYGGEAYFDEGWVAVAVKTLKVGSTTEEKLDFLSEAEVMKRFEHKNIVKLLGVCTKNEPVYTVMEFMLYGDLKTFLLARRHLVNERVVDESDEVSCKKLTSMALDVARALSYLAELKYVHRDVASRNCLVNASRVVKLGDFGMTRPMMDNDYYRFNRRGMLPVRWMAPESLGLGIFTPASDVWSYGVLLYEIITFGSFPFQGLSNNQVLEHVKAGNTITIPSGVKPNLEWLIRQCWNQDHKKRPQSSEIVEYVANNPRLLSPCLDVPLSSVQVDDTGQLEILPQRHTTGGGLRHRGSGPILSAPWGALDSTSGADQPLLPLPPSPHHNNVNIIPRSPTNSQLNNDDPMDDYCNHQDSLL